MQEFILAMGLYTEEEVNSAEFKHFYKYCWRRHPDNYNPAAYVAKISDIENYSSRRPPSYLSIKSPIRRLVHRLIALSVKARQSGREKVTMEDLFLLEGIDGGNFIDVSFYVDKFLFDGPREHKEGARSKEPISLEG